MKALLAVMRRDARRTVRAPLTTLLLLVLPLALGALISLAFGEDPPQLRLLLSAKEEGFAGTLLDRAIEGLPAERFQVTRVDSADGVARLAAGEGSALLHVPTGFLGAVLDGEPATLTLWKSSRERILPQVAEEGALILADGLSAAMDVLGEPLGTIRAMSQSDTRPSEASVADVSVAIQRTMEKAGPFLFPPAVGMETSDESGDSTATPGRIFLFVVPGLAVMALLYIADQTMRDLVREMGAGTLARCLTAPVGPATLVAGKVVWTVVLGLASLALLTPFAAPFLEGIPSLPAFLAVSVAFCLAAAGFASITYGLARNERQGGVVGNVVMLVMAFLGGSYVPLAALPPAMRALSPFTLNYWAVEGYGRVLREGAGLAAVLPNLGVLLAFAAVTAFTGGELLRRRIAGSPR